MSRIEEIRDELQKRFDDGLLVTPAWAFKKNRWALTWQQAIDLVRETIALREETRALQQELRRVLGRLELIESAVIEHGERLDLEDQ